MAGDVLAPFRFAAGGDLLLTLIDQPEVTIEASDPELIAPPQIVFFAGGEVTEGVRLSGTTNKRVSACFGCAGIYSVE